VDRVGLPDLGAGGSWEWTRSHWVPMPGMSPDEELNTVRRAVKERGRLVMSRRGQDPVEEDDPAIGFRCVY